MNASPNTPPSSGRAAGALPEMLGAAGRLARNALRGVLAATFPPQCAACEAFAEGDVVCCACEDRLEGMRGLPYCPRCARTMSPSAIHGRVCAACDSEQHWNLRGIARVGPYEAPLRSLLHSLKFGGSQRVAGLLCDALAGAILAQPWRQEIQAVTAPPMHLLRRLQRPCDHADVLAAGVARRLGAPHVRAIRRTRHTPSQIEAGSSAERFRNMAGCFATRERAGVAGRVVLAVDNVLVSGATICEAAKALRRGGARVVYAAVVARAIGRGDFQAQSAAIDAALPGPQASTVHEG